MIPSCVINLNPLLSGGRQMKDGDKTKLKQSILSAEVSYGKNVI